MTITDDDASPVLAAIADVSLRVGQTVDITASATDADTGDPISYAWRRKTSETTPALPGPPNLNQARLTFVPTATGTYTMTVTASDGAGNSDTEDVVITVTPALSVTVTPTALTVVEGASATYTVKLDAAPSGNVTVTVAGASGDVSVTGSPMTFTDQDYGTAQTITVSAASDTDATNDTATLTHSATGGGYNGVTIANVDVTVTDTTPVLQLRKDPAAVTEGTAISLEVTSDKALTGTLAVSLTLAARGSAGFDANDISGALTQTLNAIFGATPSTKGTVTIPTSTDSTSESAETYRITLNDAAAYELGADTTADGVLNDPAADVSLSIADASAAENVSSGTLSFTVTASKASSSEVTFKYTVTAESTDTATAGTDFTAVAASAKGSGSIAANALTTTIDVTLLDDNIEEADETFTVTLSEASGATISDATARGTIENDDTASLSIAAPSAVTEGDSGGTNMVFTVTLDSLSAQQVTVDYAVNAASTATSGTDHAALADGTLTFPAGTATRTITVSVTGDELDEPDETVVIKLSDPENAVLGTATATGTITDDDASPVLAAIADISYAVGQTVSVTAAATDADNDAITYAWTRKAGETTPALPQSTNVNQAQLTFVPTATGAYTMTVTASDGKGNSDTEDVVITVTPALSVTVTPTALTIDEGSSATYTVKLDTAPSGNVTVTVSGASGDVTVSGSPLTFTDQNYGTAQTVTVNAATDNDATADAAVTLTHSAAGGGYNGVTIDSVTVTITETTPVLQLLTNPSAVTEGTDISLTVTSDKARTGTLAVSLTLADRGSSGFDADDISGALGPRTFNAVFGTTPSLTAAVSIPTSSDSDVEGAETYRITLNDAAGYELGSDKTADGTLNDGTTASVTVTPTSLTVAEGGSATYTVKLNAAPSGNVTVTVAGASGDVTVSGSPMTFTAGNYGTAQTVTVSAASDTDATDDTATLTHSATGGGYNGVTIANVDVTVTDVTPVLQLRKDPAAVTEGTAISLEVTSDKARTGTLAVSLTLAARGSAGFDAADIPGTLGPRNFNAVFGATPSTKGTVTIPTSMDSTSESAETYRITLNDAAAYELGADTTADGVLNDPAADVSLSIADASAAENVSSGTLSFTVTASKASSSEVTFKYTVTSETADTATAGTDFTAVAASAKGSGSIAANAQTTTIAVTLLDDNIEEADETFTVTLSEASGATISDATARGTIENDDTASLSIAAPSAVTEGDSGGTDMVFTVTLDSLSAQQVTVDYAVDSASTATSGTDHAALADGTLTFPAGTATQTITVSVTGDELDESDETVVIELNDPENAVLGTATATGTITDDDSSPSLTAIADVSYAVGQTVDITAAATDADNDTITYAWTRKTGETTPAIPQGTNLNQARLTFTTAATGAYTMTVTASDGKGNSDTEDVVITVTPALGVTVTPTALTVAEGGSATYTVKLDAAPSGNVTVTVSGASGDVTVSGSPLTFTDQNHGTAQTVTVSAASDTDATDDTATLTHSATGGGYNGVTIADVDVTVTDTTPVLQLSTDPSAVTEGTDISLTVTSDKALTGTLDVSLTLADRGSSGFDADDITGALGPRTFTATFGNTASLTGTVTISTSTDSDAEGAETYRITLNDTDDYELGADTTADGTLNDGTTQVDPPARPTGLTAAAGSAQVVLTWTDPDDDDITGYKLRYAKTADRSSASWNLITGSDADTVTYTVTSLENGEEYSFKIRAVNAGGDGKASGWVTATPQAAAATVSVPATLTVAEGGGAATVTITASRAFGAETTFNVTYASTSSTSDTDATGANAPADGDYDNDAVTSVTFSASDTTKGISIPITDDNIEEGAETFTVTIAAAAALPDGFTLGNASTTVTITDDDSSPVLTAIADVTLRVGQTVDITASATDADTGDTISYAWTRKAGETSPALPQGTALNQARLTFVPTAAGTYTMTVTASDGNGNSDTEEVVITVTPSLSVTVTPTSLTVAEGGSATYTVNLDAEPSGTVTVTVSGASGDVTVTGSPLTFTDQNYGTAQTVTVNAAEDNDAETDAAVTLTHSASGGGYAGVTIDSVVVTITEDDTGSSEPSDPPSGVPAQPVLTGIQGGDGQVTLSWSDPGDSSITSWEYRRKEGAGEYGGWLPVPGATSGTTSYTLTGLANDVVHALQLRAVNASGAGPASVEVSARTTGSSSGGPPSDPDQPTDPGTPSDPAEPSDPGGDGGGGAGGGAGDGAGPAPGVTVSSASLTVAEGSSGAYTVVLDAEPPSDVTVTVSGASGDVTVAPSSLTFTSGDWNEARTVTVSAAQDADGIADPVVTLTHAASGGGYDDVSIASVAVSVTEDDTAGVTVSVASLTVAEGSSGVYTIALNTAPSGDATVTVSGASGDVTVVPSSLTFTSGDWNEARTVTVSAAQDADGIADPVVTLTHAASGGGYDDVSIASVAVSVTEDDTAGVTVSVASLTVEEGSRGEYTVVLETEPSGDVTVSVSGASGDVTAAPSSLTFTAADWREAQTVTVSAAQDADAFGDPEVTLTHAASGGDYGGVSVASVTVSVTEDDTPGVTVSASSLTLSEGDAGGYLLQLETEPSSSVTVSVSGASGDVTVEPSSVTFTAADWNQARTVMVSAGHDADGIADPEVTLTHSASGGDYDGVSIASVVVTVTEDDTLGVTVSASALTVTEGGAGEYTIVLDTEPSSPVTVSVSGASGDVTAAPSSLTFTSADWSEAQAVTVAVAEDADASADPMVTLTHVASGGGYDGVSIASVAVTPVENDTPEDLESRKANKVNDAVLPHMVEALTGMVPVKERIESASSGGGLPGPSGMASGKPDLGRWRDPHLPPDREADRQLRGTMGGTASFSLPLGGAGGGSGGGAGESAGESGGGAGSSTAAIWGGAEDVSFSGSEADTSWTGQLSSAHVGADFRLRPDLLLGAALSHSWGSTKARSTDVDGLGFDSVYRVDLMTLHPYAAWFRDDGSNLWASLGLGRGDIRIELDGGGSRSTDLSMSDASVGGRLVVAANPTWIAGGTTTFAVRAEGSVSEAKTDAKEGLVKLAVDTNRLRLALEGSYERSLEGGGTLTPAVEAGLRHDGGDVVAGAGVEVGASLIWRSGKRGLTMELRGRTLVAHEKDRDETAVSALLRLDPAADGRGAYLNVAPSWGMAQTGIAGMFDERSTAAWTTGAAARPEGRLEAEFGYGFAAAWLGPLGVLTPYTQLSLSQQGQGNLLLGARYTLGPDASLALEVQRQQGQAAPPDYRLELSGTFRW